MNNKIEYIICAAIHHPGFNRVVVSRPKNVDIGIVICGRRHFNCFSTACVAGIDKRGAIQGFLTSKDRFVTGEDASKIALEAGQVDVLNSIKGLLSEDLY